jgi:hypothetical protein
MRKQYDFYFMKYPSHLDFHFVICYFPSLILNIAHRSLRNLHKKIKKEPLRKDRLLGNLHGSNSVFSQESKRAPSAFGLFVKETASEFAGLKFAERMAKITERWKALDPEKKKVWVQLFVSTQLER